MTQTLKRHKTILAKNKYACTQCGATGFSFNVDRDTAVTKLMVDKGLCWECAYWEWFLSAEIQNMEVIDNRCYQVFPYTPKPSVNEVLGRKGKTAYILKKDGTCIKSNDIWWLNDIPYKYQDRLPATGWWITKPFYTKLARANHICQAKGCLDRYHCYRYEYQIEFKSGPYNKVPLDWHVGGENCPAFLPLLDIQHYDEYVKTEDIIDESSWSLNTESYEHTEKSLV